MSLEKDSDSIKGIRLTSLCSLPYQIQCCSNTAKFCLERLGKVQDLPVWPDDETTFDQLKARIAETVALLEKADPACMDGMESREVLFETKAAGTFRFETGQRYVSEFAITNFHFHMGIAYCILRQKGVDVGAFDYMNDVFVKV